jgi:hypothetical protein
VTGFQRKIVCYENKISFEDDCLLGCVPDDGSSKELGNVG